MLQETYVPPCRSSNVLSLAEHTATLASGTDDIVFQSPCYYQQLSLPAFLKLLTSGGVGLSTAEAMSSASALIKAGYSKSNVANPLTGVSEPALVAIGLTDPDTRKQLVAHGRTGKAILGSKSSIRDFWIFTQEPGVS